MANILPALRRTVPHVKTVMSREPGERELQHDLAGVETGAALWQAAPAQGQTLPT
jgi:hypothetical protein